MKQKVESRFEFRENETVPQWVHRSSMKTLFETTFIYEPLPDKN